MTRVSVYIDGFNLYHAVLKLNDPKLKWLDLWALSQRLILPVSEQLNAVYYFSAYAEWLHGSCARHQIYVAALSARGVVPIMGHFKEKDRQCKVCGAKWKAHEEKETDVNIGISLLNDAHNNRYDKALLVTRDSDLVPAVAMVLREYPSKKIEVIAPPLMGHSNDLLKVCTSKKKITPNQVKACLLSATVVDRMGNIVAIRPAEYS